MAFPHAHAAILSVGDELTLGQTLDTNSRWIAARLLDLGIVVREHATVPDDLDAHAAAFARLAGACDLVVCTGGLGPTLDDLTRHALARAMGDTLVEDPLSLAQVEGYFEARGRPMPAINRVQALRPAHATPLPNLHGTAPGLFATLRADGRACDAFCLPGPPREMIPMFESQVVPRLRPVPGRTVVTRVMHTVGIGESDLATRLGAMMDRGNTPMVGTTASGGIVSVRVRYEGPLPPDDAAAMVDRVVAQARALAGPHAFGEGPDTLASAVVHALAKRHETLAVVESCTGGLLGGALTDVPGSSSAFVGGYITYANERKQRDVGVPASIFAREGPGAVSRECAEVMARGGRERAGATFALAVTGVAGPDGGSAEKPVGTVWIALAHPAGIDARRFSMVGDRGSIRTWSVTSALAMLWLRLAKAPGTPLLREDERFESR